MGNAVQPVASNRDDEAWINEHAAELDDAMIDWQLLSKIKGWCPETQAAFDCVLELQWVSPTFRRAIREYHRERRAKAETRNLKAEAARLNREFAGLRRERRRR